MVKRLETLKGWRKTGHIDCSQYTNHVHFLAEAASHGAGMYNGLIASRPRTKHLLAALVAFREFVKNNGDLPTGMAFNRTLANIAILLEVTRNPTGAVRVTKSAARSPHVPG